MQGLNLTVQLTPKRCGAKTRTGKPCRTLPMPNGRCRMHGGKSPKWFAHPRYKHGKFSQYSPAGLFHRAAIEKRKQLRAKKKEIRKMCEGELLAKARRLFGSAARGVTADDMRFMLLAATDAQIQRSLAENPAR